jgi:hypothetical protein
VQGRKSCEKTEPLEATALFWWFFSFKPLPLDKGEVGRGSFNSDPSCILPLVRGGGIPAVL